MAVVKVAKGGQNLKSALEYADKENDFIGKDIPDNSREALEQMQLTKDIYNKPDGRQYKHYIISFRPGEVDKGKAKEIALEFVEKNFKGFEVGIGTHTDKNHIHCHLIVNSVNFETGKKFQAPKSFLNDLKKSNDEICKSHDLEIVKKRPEKELIGEIRTYDMNKYQALKQGFEDIKKSYVLDTAIAVKKAIEISKNRTEFIKNMSLEGYKTNWTDNRKHVTFTDKENNKVRLANLEKTFSDKTFSKEGLEIEFERQIRQGRYIESIRPGDNYIEFDKTHDDVRAPDVANGNPSKLDGRDKRIEFVDEIIHKSVYGQRSSREYDDDKRIVEDRADKRTDTKEYSIDFERAAEILNELRKHNAREYSESRDRIDEQQRIDDKGIDEDKEFDRDGDIEKDAPYEERDYEFEL